ncbi:MAG: GGDEF domain-containing protein [Cyanobacteria bacterium P01_D01_bin.73]
MGKGKRILRSVYNLFFLRRLDPDYDEYRISIIRLMNYFTVASAAIESVVSLLYQDFAYFSLAITCALFLTLALKNQSKDIHRTANTILLYFLCTGIGLATVHLDDVNMYIFSPITVLFLVGISGIRRGVAWALLYIAIAGISLTRYYLAEKSLPVEFEVLMGSAIAMVYTLCLSIGLENTLKKMMRRLKHASERDPLTQTYNRRKFNYFLQREIDRHHRHQSHFSLLFLDIDHFKKINDTYGHDVGDFAIKSVVSSIETNIRQADTISRYGGEEFAVLLPETNTSAAVQIAENIREYIASRKFGAIEKCTISVGVTTFEHSDSIEDLLKRADQALYIAKNNGRNRTEMLAS